MVSSDFGHMLSVGAIHFEDRFCASKKGRIGGGGWVHPGVLCTWQLPWHPRVPCTWQLPWLAREEPGVLCTWQLPWHPSVPCTWQLPWLAREEPGVLCTWQLPWHPRVPCTWQLPWLAREEPWSAELPCLFNSWWKKGRGGVHQAQDRTWRSCTQSLLEVHTLT